MRRCAVIGSGATAFAIADYLSGRSDCSVTLIHPGFGAVGDGAPRRTEPREIAGNLRRRLGFRLPPPKSHFGLLPGVLEVRNWGSIWHSRQPGGLTTFWGGAAVPFTDAELADWPIGRSDLEDDYRALAATIGITGEDDDLRTYLHDDFCDLPRLRAVPPVDRLLRKIAGTPSETTLAGCSRVAIETRPGRQRQCTMLGECMTGCRNDSIFSAAPRLALLLNRGGAITELAGIVDRVDPRHSEVRFTAADGTVSSRSFDHIFLCAGCLESNAIVMRSLGIRAGIQVTDNSVYNAPVLCTGPTDQLSSDNGYFALSNGTILVVDEQDNERSVLIQLYPTSDYFWDFALSNWRWPAVRRLGRWSRQRLFWARIYVHSRHSQRYELSLNAASELTAELSAPPNRKLFFSALWPRVRSIISGGEFFIPPIRPFLSRTSSHYSGGFPLEAGTVDRDGHLGGGIYLCDAVTFPNCPALPHTLTAMANARRIARRALM